MEHGLKDIALHVQKHIAAREVLSYLPAGLRQAAWGRPHQWDWFITMHHKIWNHMESYHNEIELLSGEINMKYLSIYEVS